MNILKPKCIKDRKHLTLPLSRELNKERKIKTYTVYIVSTLQTEPYSCLSDLKVLLFSI